MERRTFLALVGSTGSLSLAGCLGGAGPPATESPATDPGPSSPTTGGSSTPTPARDPEVSFAVGERSCGSGTNEATITFGTDAVRVDGVIGGRDTCDTAELVDAGVRNDALTIRVASRPETTGGQACAQCLTDIHYEVTARFAGELPGRVEVVHDSLGRRETVATATR